MAVWYYNIKNQPSSYGDYGLNVLLIIIVYNTKYAGISNLQKNMLQRNPETQICKMQLMISTVKYSIKTAKLQLYN